MAPAAGKVALITGVTGQDGAYLAEILLAKGYVVHGVKRRSSSFNTGRVDHLYHDLHGQGVTFFLHFGDLTDATNIVRILQETQPDEIYNLAAQSHVQVSFENPGIHGQRRRTWDSAPARGHSALCPLDHSQLSRSLWLPRLKRHLI